MTKTDFKLDLFRIEQALRDKARLDELTGTPTVCEACNGRGRVVERAIHIVDRGTRWQRSADEHVNTECSACNGAGRVL